MTNLRKRVKALEGHFVNDPIILYFEDGSSRKITGRRNYQLRLFCDIVSRDWSNPVLKQKIDWLRECVWWKDSGRTVELIRAFLPPPGKELPPLEPAIGSYLPPWAKRDQDGAVVAR